ncbi:MAG TPA: zf-HC2 domain-containing protein [Candidatus Acidoferrales bacterium]|nr:zf-HC2 domain-containing protein [Candidatus Acidoferrales bacterium]
MRCREVGRQLAGYLDGAISVENHVRVRAHLDECDTCRNDLYRFQRLARVLADVRPVEPPINLAARIREEASRIQVRLEISHPFWGRARVFFENILEPLAVPATGGLLTAAFFFLFLAQSLFLGLPIGAVTNDLPTNLIQPARVESLAPFPVPAIVGSDDYSHASVLLVEATLNAEGQVARYQILSGPTSPEVRRQIDQIMIFSRFRPELIFGRPMAGGQVMLSFSEVRVKG